MADLAQLLRIARTSAMAAEFDSREHTQYAHIDRLQSGEAVEYCMELGSRKTKLS
jgi:hypothetical protein